jgi:hypothetical protein
MAVVAHKSHSVAVLEYVCTWLSSPFLFWQSESKTQNHLIVFLLQRVVSNAAPGLAQQKKKHKIWRDLEAETNDFLQSS